MSLTAVLDGRVVGHILFTPVTIESSGDGLTLGLGPMAVATDMQRRSLGSQLVPAGLEAAGGPGAPIVVLLGHPTYYRRFGFTPASAHGLRCEDDAPDDAFMVKELEPGALADLGGFVRYGSAFGRP